MVERKFFNLWKRVPGVGFVYGGARGFAYALAGDVDEAKYSWEMDPADLNPLRMPRNIANALHDSAYDVDEGIWIGKRTLGDLPLGLTFSPGFDIHHWCIQIDGVIYELGGSKRQIDIKIMSKNYMAATYKSYCKRFSWTMLQKKSSSVSKEELEAYAKSFENYQYRAVLPTGDKVNCQTFVACMFAKAACLTDFKARATVLRITPNILF